jgi:hypothetical protein
MINHLFHLKSPQHQSEGGFKSTNDEIQLSELTSSRGDQEGRVGEDVANRKVS